MYLDELELTPNQRDEVNDADPALVAQWLEALSTKSGIKSPTGWFLKGLRSGKPPGYTRDASQARATDLAERETRNALLYCPDEADYLSAIFDHSGRLHAQADDRELRERMAQLWRTQQPRAQQAEQEMLERAARHRASRQAIPKTLAEVLADWDETTRQTTGAPQ